MIIDLNAERDKRSAPDVERQNRPIRPANVRIPLRLQDRQRILVPTKEQPMKAKKIAEKLQGFVDCAKDEGETVIIAKTEWLSTLVTDYNRQSELLEEARNIIENAYLSTPSRKAFLAKTARSALLPTPEAEPVGWFLPSDTEGYLHVAAMFEGKPGTVPLYAHPPKPEPHDGLAAENARLSEALKSVVVTCLGQLYTVVS